MKPWIIFAIVVSPMVDAENLVSLWQLPYRAIMGKKSSRQLCTMQLLHLFFLTAHGVTSPLYLNVSGVSNLLADAISRRKYSCSFLLPHMLNEPLLWPLTVWTKSEQAPLEAHVHPPMNSRPYVRIFICIGNLGIALQHISKTDLMARSNKYIQGLASPI